MTEDREGTVLLERAGYDTVLAATPAEALDAIKAGGIDLMLLDYRLDDKVSGIDFHDHVLAAGFTIPSILVTGFGDQAMLARALRAGLRDFIPKSNEYLDVLAPTVARVMLQVKTERALAARQRMLVLERQRSGQLQRLASISSQLNAALEVEAVLRLLSEEARTLVGAGQSIASLVPEADWHRAVHAVALADPGQPAPYPVPNGTGPAADVCLGPRSARINADEVATPSRALPEGARGWLAAPLIGRQGRNMGLVQLFDKPDDSFTEDDEAILIQLAQMASVAVENARFYQELRENDRRKDEFLAMLAHELRNPLAAIDGAVEVSRREALSEHFDWSKDVIQRQTKQLSRLISDLLDISRINLGKIKLRTEPLDLGTIVDRAIEAVRPLIESAEHELVVSIEPGPLHLNADPARLEQVLVNLLANAAKYTPPRGRIEVDAHLDGTEIVVAIKDTGVGIDPSMIFKIFDPFIQAEQAIDRAQGGLGIGLTLARRLVDMHDGTLSARSDGTGTGSVFTIRLPSSEAPAKPRQAAPRPARTTDGRPSLRILVVDDSVDTARAMARLLGTAGYEVIATHDGLEAIAAARDQRPDVLLLDIGLPGLDGYEIARQVRREEALAGATLIAISGYSQDKDRRRSREAGFDHHLAKPVDYELLFSLLDAATRETSKSGGP
jgi:signal transduction histidine kinase/DNA-binding response OmpR family regulator